MAELLVTKKADGNYALSAKGILEAYLMTMRRLLAHYIQNGLKKSPQETQILLQNFSRFAQEKLTKPEAFLDNLGEIAKLIGEANLNRFSAFIGQHFLTQLEKNQQQLLAQEVAKVKNILEVPYRTPSMDLLLEWGDLFLKSKPLVYPPPQAEPSQALDEGVIQTELKVTQEKEKLPGERLLALFQNDFLKAEPLNWKPSLPAQEEISERVVVLAEEKSPTTLPGERLLQELAEEFKKAPPLKFVESEVQEEERENEIEPKLPVQVTLREYLSLVQNVKKFLQNKDQQGYQTWYSQLDLRNKVILHLNNLIQRNSKGEAIYWPDEYLNLSQRANLETKILEKMKGEIEAYIFVVNKIQEILQKAVQKNLPQAMAQNLYSQFISLFENKDNYPMKKTAIKMSLLSVTNLEAKTFLENELLSLLEKVAELYPLERES